MPCPLHHTPKYLASTRAPAHRRRRSAGVGSCPASSTRCPGPPGLIQVVLVQIGRRCSRLVQVVLVQIGCRCSRGDTRSRTAWSACDLGRRPCSGFEVLGAGCWGRSNLATSCDAAGVHAVAAALVTEVSHGVSLSRHHRDATGAQAEQQRVYAWAPDACACTHA